MAIVRWAMLMVALLRDAAAVAARRKVEDSMVRISSKDCVNDEQKCHRLFGAMLTSLQFVVSAAPKGHFVRISTRELK